MRTDLPAIVELRRLASPVATPQALAWHDKTLWIGSRDERQLVAVEPEKWTVVEDTQTPGIPWSAVSVNDALCVTLGEGPEDDRYLRRYVPGGGFDGSYRVALPDFTGSYVSFDGEFLLVSQWYKHRVLQIEHATGEVLRTIPIGAEICGHVFVDDQLYVLRGTEQAGESWQVARLDLRDETPDVQELARVPFACRSLTFDGHHFWTNHRAANETVSFALPILSR